MSISICPPAQTVVMTKPKHGGLIVHSSRRYTPIDEYMRSRLRALVSGAHMTTADIAVLVGVSSRTVERYRAAVRRGDC
jgi:FixJ family two-component response regulator